MPQCLYAHAREINTSGQSINIFFIGHPCAILEKNEEEVCGFCLFVEFYRSFISPTWLDLGFSTLDIFF